MLLRLRRMNNKEVLTWISLIALVLQNTSLVLLLRYSRTMKAERYLSSTAVVTAELLKGLICIILVWFENNFSFSRSFNVINEEIYQKPAETSRLAIPSGIYAIQSNLLFIALSYLNAATYQVTYQLKILTTALFSMFILGTKIDRRQWFSLLLLALGVAFVTWPSPEDLAKRVEVENQASWWQQSMGFAAVIMATMTSGFAGVYFENILKTGTTSVWIRNIQLALFGLLFGLGIVFCFDRKAVMEKGFFQGYSPIVWTVILLQAMGGLIIATVIKYANNIIKGFATSISILLSSVISYFLLHDFIPSLYFYLGTILVLSATFLYGWEKPKATLISINEQNRA